MHVLIIGAAGMLGRKLAQAVGRDGLLGASSVLRLTLADVVAPQAPVGFQGDCARLVVDLAQEGVGQQLIAARPDVIFHLAAIVSGEAEANFEKGYAVNLDATRTLFEAIRRQSAVSPYRPRVVFTSSLAVFGPPFPDQVPDDFLCTPRTSYGTQKAMGELLLADYTRRGFLDGIGLRMPTICIRPGHPNKAASGFFSNILREPLVGKEAILPVDDKVRHWFASPRAAVAFMLHAATMDTGAMGHRRIVNMPGLSATVEEQIAALRRVAGEAATALIRREPDTGIAGIVAGWPRNFAALRAKSLGFVAETSFDEIIQVHIEDELDGQAPAN